MSPVCDAETDFGLSDPERVLRRVIDDSEGSDAIAEVCCAVSRAIEIEMPAAILCVRMPARLLVKINHRLRLRNRHHHRSNDACCDLRDLHPHPSRHLHPEVMTR